MFAGRGGAYRPNVECHDAVLTPPPFRPDAMTLTLLVGISIALVTTIAAVAYQRAPTRARCPECGGATEAVMAPYWLRRTAPRLQGKWCPRCSWEGLGRTGPEWVKGRRVSHDSGFHWGSVRFPEDFGFQWHSRPAPASGGEPPHHPSGFRFGTTEEEEKDAGEPVHPSGFAWRPSPEGAAGRSSFRPPAIRAVFARSTRAWSPFVWGDRRKRSRRPPPFRWKGVV
jgi:hypothetical protein